MIAKSVTLDRLQSRQDFLTVSVNMKYVNIAVSLQMVLLDMRCICIWYGSFIVPVSAVTLLFMMLTNKRTQQKGDFWHVRGMAPFAP